MKLAFFLVLFLWIKRASSTACPAVYQRFSSTHSFCLKPNRNCDIKFSGVSKKDRYLILKLHNRYRNIVATGKEARARGGALPTAADMLQMVWDNELAAIAQRWTNNCKFQHDCTDGCRTVESFKVGQNLAIQTSSCPSKGCTRKEEKKLYKPNWSDRIKSLYDEVLDYRTTWFDSYQTQTKDVGHFTQIVWSKSWRIGCGYTVYKKGDIYYKFYACNYGPGGNVQSVPLYTKGKPCSACPVNTCCGKSCGKKMDYSGLCKMLDPKTAPVYPRKTKDLLFFCDSVRKTKDCKRRIKGVKTWKHVNAFSGKYDSIELKGGQSTKVKYKKKIKPSTSGFCLRIVYRKGSSKAGKNDESFADLEIITGNNVSIKKLSTSALQFISYDVSLNWNSKTKIALIFYVPKGGKPHIFDLKEIIAYEGTCGSREV